MSCRGGGIALVRHAFRRPGRSAVAIHGARRSLQSDTTTPPTVLCQINFTLAPIFGGGVMGSGLADPVRQDGALEPPGMGSRRVRQTPTPSAPNPRQSHEKDALSGLMR
ncbi:hypothetical protein [Nitrincola sp.]|uniref:hypothetical protein n=1 Tax=Nitrincola sp. TaxID=1926584 RepID=UPI003A8E546E